MRSLRAVLVGVLVVAATGGCGMARPPAQPPVVVRPAPTAYEVTVAPTTAPPPPGQDVILDAIRSAPAACGLPIHYLSGYGGRVGDTETILQVSEGYQRQRPPVEPLQVDLTGDGGLDLVGVLSCTVAGVSKPDNIVLYTGPATPVAALELTKVQKEKSAVVRGLRTVGGEVQVEWTAFDSGSGPVRQYQGIVAWNGRALEIKRAAIASGPRSIKVDSGSFMASDGNVHCTMHPGMAWCDVLASTWTPPTSPPPVPDAAATTGPTASAAATPTTPSTAATTAQAGCGDRPYGRTFLIAEGRARQTCRGEQGPETAALGSGLTTWHRRGWDATVTVDGRRSAAMTPGSTMTATGVSCRATASEVTCTDERTRASFTAGRTVARVTSG